MAITVKSSFGSGNAGLNPRGNGSPSLATILRGLIDDVAAVRVGTISTANASDLATAIALANAIKTAINAAATASATPTVTKG